MNYHRRATKAIVQAALSRLSSRHDHFAYQPNLYPSHSRRRFTARCVDQKSGTTLRGLNLTAARVVAGGAQRRFVVSASSKVDMEVRLIDEFIEVQLESRLV